MELPDTKTIHLKWPDGHNPEFKTGQFITLYWPDTTNYKRAYSLSSCALDRGFYEVTVTRATPEDNWTGRTGRITPEWIKEIATDLPNTVFYACGPNALVEFAEHLVVHELGVVKEQMKTEKWG